MIGPDDLCFLLLATISVTYSISVRRLERLRRALSEEKMPDLISTWTFAAALTLPPLYIAAVVTVTYLAEWPSRRIVRRANPLKYIYTGAAAASSCVVASVVLHAVDGVAGVPLAMLTHSAVDIALIATAVMLARQKHVLRMFANPRAHAAEAATQCLGIALAGLLNWNVAMGVLVVPALLLVHHWSLRETVKVEEAFDPVTRLWSETAWMVQAQQMLHDVHGHVALLMIDPDEAGQELRILQSIESGLHPSDLLGRYGTRQIVVLIPVGRREGGPFLSTGFRADLAANNIPAAIGCATTADSELEALLIE
ncbi:hypothetical protein, partial [Jatrophihabitans sp.]|uniref:hypothetical protein n=1 Tax=Jatrophihabitans sp. TaxID=1932789 RepID=UPI002EEA6F23